MDGDGADVVVRLQASLRPELKEPLGPVHGTEALLAAVGRPLVAVGDVVTYHLLSADRRPDVAVVDGKTERETVETAVWEAIEGFDRRVEVTNPAATLTAELLTTLRAAIARDGTTVVVVDGEEDLATLPAVVLAPDGASVVYGQPGEGMVHGLVDATLREETRALLGRMEGDLDRLWSLLE
jgi:uncharacterized protein (UPF0218 family)